MRRMTILEEQHDEIVMLVRAVAARIAKADFIEQASSIAGQLEQMTGKLAVHLALEDLMVCKPMIQSKDIAIKTAAANFRGDVMCLHDICINFAETWREEDIKARPQEFIIAFRSVASLLVGRFELVTRQVYPVASRLAG